MTNNLSNAEKLRAWRSKNRERYRKQENAWRAKNREKLREQRRALIAKNPEKYRSKRKEWREKNKERQAQRCREWRFSKREVSVPMPGACQICEQPRGNSNLYWDHNHTTGAHRGWLCNHCNLGIGQFSENPERLRAAAEYIENALRRADAVSAELREWQAR